MKEQKENNEINEDIGKHNQVFLEGWKVKPKTIEVEYEEDGKKLMLIQGSQKENLALMANYQEEPKRVEIFDDHFNQYLQQVLRLSDKYDKNNKPYKSEPNN